MAKRISQEERLRVFNKYQGRCAYCGDLIYLQSFQVDHIEPRYRGWTDQELDRYKITRGSNSFDNYNPSCKSCNSSKSVFTVEGFRQQLENKVKSLRGNSSQFRILERYGKVSVNNSPIKFYFEEHES